MDHTLIWKDSSGCGLGEADLELKTKVHFRLRLLEDTIVPAIAVLPLVAGSGHSSFQC